MKANAVKRATVAAAVIGAALLAGCSSSKHSATSASGMTLSPPATTVVPGSPPETAPIGVPSGTSGMPPITVTGGGGGVVTATSSAAPSASRPSHPSSSGPVASPPSASSSNKCLSGTFSVIFPATDNPVRSACLHMGTSVNIELLVLRGVTWSVPSVSDPSVATVTDEVTAPGTHDDHVTLLRSGTVTLTSASSYSPDPQAPPSRQWTLTLTIVP